MHAVDIKQFELLELRIVKLEKMLEKCLSQIQINNDVLEKILISVNSAQLNYSMDT